MGLSINNYQSSYSTLHRLRRIALLIEENSHTLEEIYDVKGSTRFNEFINHSDCEGGYISYKTFGIKDYKDESYMCGDLDKLKKEVEEIKENLDRFENPMDRRMMENFIKDVEDSKYVLVFR